MKIKEAVIKVQLGHKNIFDQCPYAQHELRPLCHIQRSEVIGRCHFRPSAFIQMRLASCLELMKCRVLEVCWQKRAIRRGQQHTCNSGAHRWGLLSGRLLHVFVFQGPTCVFSLVHYNGRNPVVWGHLPSINLQRRTSHPMVANSGKRQAPRGQIDDNVYISFLTSINKTSVLHGTSCLRSSRNTKHPQNDSV